MFVYFFFVFFSADDLVFCSSDTIGGSVPVSKGGGCLDGSGNENAVEFIFVAESLLVVGQQHCELLNDGSATAATAAGTASSSVGFWCCRRNAADAAAGTRAGGAPASAASAGGASRQRERWRGTCSDTV